MAEVSRWYPKQIRRVPSNPRKIRTYTKPFKTRYFGVGVGGSYIDTKDKQMVPLSV